MALLKVTGFDPSLRHWGVAQGTYDTCTTEVQIHALDVVEPIIPTGKQIRQKSKDVIAATQLAEAALKAEAGGSRKEEEARAQGTGWSLGAKVAAGIAAALGLGGVAYAAGRSTR